MRLLEIGRPTTGGVYARRPNREPRLARPSHEHVRHRVEVRDRLRQCHIHRWHHMNLQCLQLHYLLQ